VIHMPVLANVSLTDRTDVARKLFHKIRFKIPNCGPVPCE
jgi:hypothetical protein